MEKTAAIIGATGLTGSCLLNLLLKDDYFSTVRVIVRRPMANSHPRMEIKLVDFDDAESLKLALEETHTVFCCIGTTQSKVKGDKELYRKIDLEIPRRAARFAKEAGCEQFIIISSTGANPRSRNFYLQLKGETEQAIKASGIASIHIMRPSQLMGHRNERRPMERFVQATMKLLSPLIPARFKAIDASCVANAMLVAAKKGDAGFFVHENEEIKQSCRGIMNS